MMSQNAFHHWVTECGSRLWLTEEQRELNPCWDKPARNWFRHCLPLQRKKTYGRTIWPVNLDDWQLKMAEQRGREGVSEEQMLWLSAIGCLVARYIVLHLAKEGWHPIDGVCVSRRGDLHECVPTGGHVAFKWLALIRLIHNSCRRAKHKKTPKQAWMEGKGREGEGREQAVHLARSGTLYS